MKPTYRVGFSIEPGPELEDILAVGQEWVNERLRTHLKDFNSGMTTQNRGNFLETIRVVDSPEQHFAFKFSHPDSKERDLRWETQFALREKEDQSKDVEIMVGHEWKGGIIKPVNTQTTRPFLVPRLINKFHSKVDYRLITTPKKVTIENIDDFVNLIFDEKRTLPIVYASVANFDSRPKVDAKFLASQLAGMARVCVAADNIHSHKLAYLIGKSMSCYDGAVRLYWPTDKENLRPSQHRYWSRKEIAESRGIERELLETLTEFALSTPSRITYADVRRAAMGKQIEDLREKGELSDLAEGYAEENNDLRREIELMKSQESGYRAKISGLTQRIILLEDTINRYKENGDYDEEKRDAIDINSVREAINQFQKMYPVEGSNVFVHSRVEKAARNSQFRDPEMVFRGLEWLATAYLEMHSGNSEETDLAKSCKEQTGFTYTSHQSKTTMGRQEDDYFIKYKGRKLQLREHLCKGTSRDPRDSIRIAFHYLKNQGKIVVGYLGLHQRNKAS